MHSFTFNFKQEAPVLGFVALILLTCEIGLRAFGTRTSLDLQHIRSIPEIVSTMKNSNISTLLFLGNSLTRRAVVPEVLTEDLAKQGYSKIHIAEIYPDDTNMADWHYIYKRYVHEVGADPNLLLIGFAEEQLSDTQVLHIDRLGRYFGGLDALSEAFHYDVQDFNSRISYLLASLSCAYANRDHVRTELFGAIIPFYKTSAQTLNTAVKVRHDNAKDGMSQHYKRLTRFLERITGTSTKVVFVAIPLPSVYPLDPSLESVLLVNGVPLIDLRRTEGLTESDFLDGYHLSPHGGAIFTRELARRLLASGVLRNLRKRDPGSTD